MSAEYMDIFRTSTGPMCIDVCFCIWSHTICYNTLRSIRFLRVRVVYAGTGRVRVRVVYAGRVLYGYGSCTDTSRVRVRVVYGYGLCTGTGCVRVRVVYGYGSCTGTGASDCIGVGCSRNTYNIYCVYIYIHICIYIYIYTHVSLSV